MPNKFNNAKLPSWKGLSGAAASKPWRPSSIHTHKRPQGGLWNDIEATTRRAILLIEEWAKVRMSDPKMSADHKAELQIALPRFKPSLDELVWFLEVDDGREPRCQPADLLSAHPRARVFDADHRDERGMVGLLPRNHHQNFQPGPDLGAPGVP